MTALMQGTRTKRILVVDDQAEIADLVRDILSSYGYDVKTADETSVYRASHEHLPDLILLDLKMPRTTGDEAFSRLKASPETADIPIVIMSAERDLVRRALRMGASGYLAKPFYLHDLLAIVTDAVGSADGS